jgi:hypothetical protein
MIEPLLSLVVSDILIGSFSLAAVGLAVVICKKRYNGAKVAWLDNVKMGGFIKATIVKDLRGVVVG